MNKGLLVVPSGSVTAEDRRLANESGYCVIESDDPEKVRLLLPESCLCADDLTMAALEAIQGAYSGSQRELFTKLLFAKLKTRKAKINESDS